MQHDFRGMWVKVIYDDDGGGGGAFLRSHEVMQYFMCNI